MTSNLDVWNAGAEVPKEATKEFNNGRFKGTDINRMWRIKVLTELFGPAGVGWDWKLTEVHDFKLEQDDRVVLFAKGELRLWNNNTKMWSQPIIGYGGNDLVQSNSKGVRINDDAYKMVDTDAFGSACSKLGIGASVYWNEMTKYTSEKADDEPNGGFIPKTVKTPVPAQTITEADRKSAEEEAKAKANKNKVIEDIRWKCCMDTDKAEYVRFYLQHEHGYTGDADPDKLKKAMSTMMNLEQLKKLSEDMEVVE